MNLRLVQPRMKFDLSDWVSTQHAMQKPTRNRPADLGYLVRYPLECADGFTISVQASSMHYCIPRVNHGPWTEVECGSPNQEVTELAEWKDGDGHDTESVFGWVPVSVVEALIELHGGVKT